MAKTFKKCFELHKIIESLFLKERRKCKLKTLKPIITEFYLKEFNSNTEVLSNPNLQRVNLLDILSNISNI